MKKVAEKRMLMAQFFYEVQIRIALWLYAVGVICGFYAVFYGVEFLLLSFGCLGGVVCCWRGIRLYMKYRTIGIFPLQLYRMTQIVIWFPVGLISLLFMISIIRNGKVNFIAIIGFLVAVSICPLLQGIYFLKRKKLYKDIIIPEEESMPNKSIIVVPDHCKIEAYIIEKKKRTIITINSDKYENQHVIIGKNIGDTFQIPGITLTYQIMNVWFEETEFEKEQSESIYSNEASSSNKEKPVNKVGYIMSNYANLFEGDLPTEAEVDTKYRYRTVYVNTNAEFLNAVFGTNYVQYCKGIWAYNGSIDIWMVPFNDKVNQWTNRLLGEGEYIEETYFGSKPNAPVRFTTRVAVCKKQGCYSILGLYIPDLERSDLKKRFYKKVPDKETYRCIPIIFEK